jgi:uncharacterized protein
MSTSHARGIKPDTLNDEHIADYLQTYPDFFERNSPLLAKLRLPHLREAGSTVSLMERQVEVLRERNASLERKLKELLDVARSNDALAERIHRLCQRLILTHGTTDTLQAIEASLREDFDMLHTVMLLFASAGQAAMERGVGRFVRPADRESADIKGFDSLLQSGKPRCGQIRDTQRDFLFGPDVTEIASVALTPLGDKGSLGLLAIGASDTERFNPAMSTEFLSRIGELIAKALTRA